jgi:hypothetical protein
MARTNIQQQQNLAGLAQAGTADREEPVRIALPLFSGGMRTDKSPIDLQPNETVSLENLNLVAGDLSTDTGYTPFGSTYLGQAQQTFQAFFADGTTADLLVTTATIYNYVVTAQQWQLVSFGAAYSISHGGGYPIGTNAFNLASVTGLTNGKPLGVLQSDGTQLIGTIINIAGTIVTINTASTQTVNNGASVALGTTLNGDASGNNQVIMTTFPGNGWVIISNGIDPIMYYFGGVVQLLPGLPTNTTCKALIVTHEQLMIGSTIENGTAHPQRIRTSDQADPTNWTTGLAAIYDLLDTEDFILSLNILGPYTIVYRETTIMRGSYLGLPNQTWFWEYMVYGEGAISQGAVAEVGAEHVFVGNAGIYYYRGDYTIESIGDAVYFTFLSALGDLNPKAKSTLFCQYVGDFDEIWIFYPGGEAVFPNRMLRCVLEDNSWYHRTFFDQFVSCQPRLSLAEFTWATIPGAWTDHPEPWDSRIFLQNVPNFLLCSITASTLMIYDYTTQTDNGHTIAWQIITKQYAQEPDKITRWERLTLYGAGSIDLIEFSMNEGTTWTTIGGPYVFTETFDRIDVYIDRVLPRLQFRISGADAFFVLRGGMLSGVWESDW